MLLELKNTTDDNLEKLMVFAKQNNIPLVVVDDTDAINSHLPGKPLTGKQLTRLIESSRKSGIIAMQDAHTIIREHMNGD